MLTSTETLYRYIVEQIKHKTSDTKEKIIINNNLKKKSLFSINFIMQEHSEI